MSEYGNVMFTMFQKLKKGVTLQLPKSGQKKSTNSTYYREYTISYIYNVVLLSDWNIA